MAEVERVSLEVEQFVHNPRELRRTLDEHGVFEFMPFPSGLFPACALEGGASKEIGYDMWWFRDNTHLAAALALDGRMKLARGIAHGFMRSLNGERSQDILDGIGSGRYDPADPAHRLYVRANGVTMAPDTEARAQNDSVGYPLWLESSMALDRRIELSRQDVDTLTKMVRYLGKIVYWQDADAGHWEEEHAPRSSSIGTVMAGLRDVRTLFQRIGHEDHGLDMQEMTENGEVALQRLLPYETRVAPGDPTTKDRPYDAAQLFLVEPLRLFDGDQAKEIVERITTHLMRTYGYARYLGDTYWGPDFPERVPEDERTTQKEGSLERRNSRAGEIEAAGDEANWHIFDQPVTQFWGRRFVHFGGKESREKWFSHFNRALRQLVVLPDGRWQYPEATYKQHQGTDLWIPNRNMSLYWAAAGLLRNVNLFETVLS